MRKVKNKKIISRLSRKILFAKKKKNIIAVMAIALTAILFTTVFTIGGNMFYTNTQNSLIQVGSKSHGGFKNFTMEEYQLLEKDKKIKDLSYNIFVGFTTNEELKKLQCEVRYFQDLSAKNAFSYPTTGRMPENENEVAVSSIILDALGISHKLGEQVTLEMQIHNKPVTKTFTLCGFWIGKEVASAQEVAVSRTFSDSVAPLEMTPYYERAENDYDVSGYLNCDFNFGNSFNIEKQMDDLCERLGFDQSQVNTGVNWAYGFAEVDMNTFFLIIAVLALILLSGYLIIYNVFYLNIYGDIRFYGLLKTIGTTGRQLRKIVYRQAWSLCLLGIPAGLLVGWLVGRLLTPVIMDMLVMGETYYSVNPLIFVGAALFAWFTVTISCIKPCKIASRVSPVEAVKYTGNSGHAMKAKKNVKKNSLFNMAGANLRRNRRKLILVICSCALSMILLNSVYTVVTGFDMDRFISNYMITDFSVTDATINTYTGRDTVYDGVTTDFIEAINEREDIEKIGNIYMIGNEHKLSDKEYADLKRIFSKEKYEEYMNNRNQKAAMKEIMESGKEAMNIYGVDEVAAEMVQIFEGEFNWEKFKSGKYVIVNAVSGWDIEGSKYEDPFSELNDTITIQLPSGESKDYQVMAIGEVPYAINSRMSTGMGREFILPESEIHSLVGPRQPLRTVFNAKQGETESVEKWLRDYTEKIDSDMGFESKNTYIQEFKTIERTYVIAGGFLCFILALIGILNFINVMVTSILSRRQELAMMESIGMTGDQQKKMLQLEGMLYGVFTIGITCTVGIAIGYGIVQLVAGQIWMFTWHFTLFPIVICAPILLFISAIVPLICYRHICAAGSIVERLRIVE